MYELVKQTNKQTETILQCSIISTKDELQNARGAVVPLESHPHTLLVCCGGGNVLAALRLWEC